jgi:hypothetical protein
MFSLPEEIKKGVLNQPAIYSLRLNSSVRNKYLPIWQRYDKEY